MTMYCLPASGPVDALELLAAAMFAKGASTAGLGGLDCLAGSRIVF